MLVIRLLLIGGLMAFAIYECVQFVKLCKEKKKDKVNTDNKKMPNNDKE